MTQEFGVPGPVAQLVASPSVDQVFMSLLPARSHTISTTILLPSADSRRVVVIYKGKYVHKVLVNCIVKLAQEKSVVR